MRKLKSAIVLLLVFAMVISLTACDNDKNQNVAESNSPEGNTLNIIATTDNYKKLFDKFTEDTSIKVEFITMSSGEVLSRTKAEGGKPMADVWFSGCIDAFMAAKDEGLLEKYISPEAEDIPDKYKDSDGYWMAKGITAVGFLVNNDVLEEKELPVPKSWQDLADPKYKDEVIMSNPAISGTNYAAVYGLLEGLGEEKGWEYLEKLDNNIPFYTKRGGDPFTKTVQGEAAIGIIPIGKKAFDIQEERNVSVVFPEDGMPWILEGMAIFKNCDNLNGAKAFFDWVLKEENQQLLAEIEGKDGALVVKPGVKGFELGVPTDKFIDEDITAFGTAREEILEKWMKMVGDK